MFTGVSLATICRPHYTEAVRRVGTATRRAVFAEYGLVPDGQKYELDHLISLELGGSNERANLWPEALLPRPGFRQKDALENRLHAMVCSSRMTLADAQRLIATSWLSEYEALYP